MDNRLGVHHTGQNKGMASLGAGGRPGEGLSYLDAEELAVWEG